jgi:hypothetical protein
MSLVVDGGGLVNKGGALGTGAACCCNKCSGPCDGENPCPEGCQCVDGECVSSPCVCGLPYPAGTTVTAEFTVTLKDGMTTCVAGTATKAITLNWNGSQYYGTDTITEVGPARLTAYLYCFGNSYYFLGVVNNCDYCSWDIFGSGGNCGMGAESVVSGVTVDGRCVPPPNSQVASAPEDPPVEQNPEDYGLNFSVTLSVAGP